MSAFIFGHIIKQMVPSRMKSLLDHTIPPSIMRNTGLAEAQAGIKIAGRNINNLRCADDTTLMAESKEELKSL